MPHGYYNPLVLSFSFHIYSLFLYLKQLTGQSYKIFQREPCQIELSWSDSEANRLKFMTLELASNVKGTGLGYKDIYISLETFPTSLKWFTTLTHAYTHITKADIQTCQRRITNIVPLCTKTNVLWNLHTLWKKILMLE